MRLALLCSLGGVVLGGALVFAVMEWWADEPEPTQRTAPEVLRAIRDINPDWCMDIPDLGLIATIDGPRRLPTQWVATCSTAVIRSGEVVDSPKVQCVRVTDETLEVTFSAVEVISAC